MQNKTPKNKKKKKVKLVMQSHEFAYQIDSAFFGGKNLYVQRFYLISIIQLK